ncbi:aminopeptidase n [Chrysochromulina tobinii]|jgi:aminopeptidase N|uniref:Aminopeptidase n n=1 Tax=Chrysochromulina tobinii TaxID=1460289 RepID=A0A0M0JN14_9EUKA|nr:aminopeptidase n [Chrysochromulina tobinii]|eukprot:KOO27722.1 aminopeptidase n [Chrysochromulina sp. CCMP291]
MIGRALFTSAAAAGAVAVAVYLYRRRKGAPTPASVASTPGKKTKALKEIRRVDYTTPPINIESVRLVAKLDEPNASTERGKAVSIIETALGCYYNPSVPESELVLHAEDMDVLEVAVSHQGKVKSILSPGRDYVYDAEAETLTIQRAALVGNGSDVFTLHTVVAIDPEANKQLQGLFKSSGIFCTQMEAEGYRRMTPHLDRPDVLSVYTVRIEADAGSCPVLLSNGNRTGAGALPNGRHFAEYHDPFPKPSYLFALVAGRLGVLSGQFTTAWAKREVTLNIYTEPECVDQLEFGMACIQKAMRWDEEQFGREYDLDVFNIVAVADFNMGAMENKGLNVFNSKCA